MAEFITMTADPLRFSNPTLCDCGMRPGDAMTGGSTVVTRMVAGLRLGAVVGLVATSLIAGDALAAEYRWTPTSVRGVVVYLLDGKWAEVTRGQELGQATLRTLRSGRLRLAGPGVTLEVGPNSALQFVTKPDGSAGTIQQYLGSINVAATQNGAGLTVQTGKVTLSSITGELTVLVADTGTSIVVESGTAAVTSIGGHRLVLETGTYSADPTGMVVEQSSGAAAATMGAAAAMGSPNGAANANADGAANANANSAANGNGSGNGNSGGGNNGGGNTGNNGGGGGGGNGISGGNGTGGGNNGNSGGNGNGGGGANGSAGGNGNT
jgi:hypothetical protein